MGGMFEAAREVLRQGLDAGAFAGAVALVAHGDTVLLHEAFGQASLEPATPMTTETIFDLASLTKVVCTTTLVLQLADQGMLALDDGIGHFLPEWLATDSLSTESLQERARVTVRHLLTHTAGLPAWYPLYSEARTPSETLATICRLGLANPPGMQVEYSDMGFILLGMIVERLAKASLDVCFRDHVAKPLGLAHTGFRPERGPFAATERGNRFEMAMTAQGGLHFEGWRDPDTIIIGEANDGNAYYAMGGVSGHAGLFATAGDLYSWAQIWLHRGKPLLSAAAVASATRNQTSSLNLSRGLGWDSRLPLDSRAASAAVEVSTMQRFQPSTSSITPVISPRSGGDWLSTRAFGHTGFTGTSIWIDPDNSCIIILLTNRIHPDASNNLYRLYRPRFHNAVIAGLG